MAEFMIDAGAEIWSMPVGGGKMGNEQPQIFACPSDTVVVAITWDQRTKSSGGMKCSDGTTLDFTPIIATDGAVIAAHPNGIGRLIIATDHKSMISMAQTLMETVAYPNRDEMEFSDLTPSRASWNMKNKLIEVAHPLGAEKGERCPINAVRIWRGPQFHMAQFRFAC